MWEAREVVRVSFIHLFIHSCVNEGFASRGGGAGRGSVNGYVDDDLVEESGKEIVEKLENPTGSSM